MVFQPMTILDLSYGGAQIGTPFPLQLDSLHDFRLSLGDVSVVLKGRIANCHIGDLGDDGMAVYCSGIEFVELSPHVRHAIASFVDACRNSSEIPPVIEGQLAED
jgi:hypothetical protein